MAETRGAGRPGYTGPGASPQHPSEHWAVLWVTKERLEALPPSHNEAQAVCEPLAARHGQLGPLAVRTAHQPAAEKHGGRAGLARWPLGHVRLWHVRLEQAK